MLYLVEEPCLKKLLSSYISLCILSYIKQKKLQTKKRIEYKKGVKISFGGYPRRNQEINSSRVCQKEVENVEKE